MKHVHMIAVCGVGMAPLAVMLKEAGYRVSGSDKAAYPPMSEVLAEAGIEIQPGFDPVRLEPRPDLVIVGNAVPRTNPEAQAAERLGLRRMSLPEAVSSFFLEGKRSLVVAGTHGKTTTTAMLVRALQSADLDPGYLIGGLAADLGKLAHRGGGAFFAVEGDEYDSAYFDKNPKFLHYRPSAAIVTSLEFDHADIYRDLAHVKSAFRSLAALMPAEAPLVCCGDATDLLEAVRDAGPARILTYGLGESCRWRLVGLGYDGGGSRAEVRLEGRRHDELRLAMYGEMNLVNALGVYALCSELGVDATAVKRGLAGFRGAVRRQQVLADGAVAVVDDFAHHPTAIAATIAAVRARYPGRPLRAIFEPRSNTSRRRIFQARFADALAAADSVVLSAVYAKENDPLAPEEMLSTERLETELCSRGVEAWVGDGPDAIFDRLAEEVESGEVLLCMSNGEFGNLPRRLAERFADA